MEWLWDQTCIRTSKRLISAEMIACRAQSDCLPPEKLQAKCESLTQIQNTHCWCTGKISKNKTSQTPNSNNSEKKIQLQNDHLYGHTSSNHVMYLSHKIIRWLVSISSHPFCAIYWAGKEPFYYNNILLQFGWFPFQSCVHIRLCIKLYCFC